MAVVSCWQLPVFRELRVEDSTVLAIRESPTELRFDMEFVLGMRHPMYRAPADDGNCYRKGRMIFRGVHELRWLKPLSPNAADGELGSIERFVLDGTAYKLAGPWGTLELCASTVDVDVF
ncbi:MAG: hypothetical protein IPG50_17785 [Myxococcales bacterium]|nr:hypothetical protein [Myxococcales bacterium]